MIDGTGSAPYQYRVATVCLEEHLEPKWFLVAQYENECGCATILWDREVYLTKASYPTPNAGYSRSTLMFSITHLRKIEW